MCQSEFGCADLVVPPTKFVPENGSIEIESRVEVRNRDRPSAFESSPPTAYARRKNGRCLRPRWRPKAGRRSHSGDSPGERRDGRKRQSFRIDAVHHDANRRNQHRPEANVASPTGLNVEAPRVPRANRLAWAVLDARKAPPQRRASSTAPLLGWVAPARLLYLASSRATRGGSPSVVFPGTTVSTRVA